MKKDLPELDPDNVDFPLGHNDWREDPDDVLEEVDRLLEPFGIEVHTYNTGADFYQFSLHRKPEAKYAGTHPANIAAIMREQGMDEELAASVERLGRLAGVKFLGD